MQKRNALNSIVRTSAVVFAACLIGCGSGGSSTAMASKDAANNDAMMDTGGASMDADTTLYERLGKKSGIATFVDNLVAAEVQDPQIAAFFADNDGNHPGHPSVAEIKQCLVLQIGAATGGPESYPAKLPDGFMCEDMAAAHAGLGISSDVFDKFVSIAAQVATDAGIKGDDLNTIAGFLNGTKSDIVGK